MGAPYSLDLRERVVAAVAGGKSRAAAARQYGVSHSTRGDTKGLLNDNCFDYGGGFGSIV